jgi:phosphatidylinositol kinase/protein kinase (PI-3  family)
MVAKSLVVDRCRVMSSKKLPLWLVFEAIHEAGAADSSTKTHTVLFKAGDDLRQDQLTLQILGIMNILWRKEGKDLRMSPYLCVSTGDYNAMHPLYV